MTFWMKKDDPMLKHSDCFMVDLLTKNDKYSKQF